MVMFHSYVSHSLPEGKGFSTTHPVGWVTSFRPWRAPSQDVTKQNPAVERGTLPRGAKEQTGNVWSRSSSAYTHRDVYVYNCIYIYKTIEYNIIIYYIYIIYIYVCVFVCVCLWTIHRQNGRFTLLERGFGDPMGSPGIQQLGGSSRHQDECWVLETTYLGHVWEILGNI